ncbi:MAG: sodium:proton antiporter [Deltaproteobacteria bacterium]|nr:sodium:proton antiporter [Deltaproteobacteria bacterium]
MKFIEILQEFSIPLLLGVVCAMVAANAAPDWYEHALHWQPFGHVKVFGHALTFHFLINDLFMIFFFGIAAKEITESCLPGGSLNPMSKAATPLMATIGGVVGPVSIFFLGLWLCFQFGVYELGVDDYDGLSRGWGIPTATDIALAWLAARMVFGRGHPAVAFLLLLAVADDAIGLGIIAIWYGDAAHPTDPRYLILVALAMVLAYGLRRAGVKHWIVYVGLAGPLAWSGLVLAHLHPALALAVVIPFIPGPLMDTGLFVDQDDVDVLGEEAAETLHLHHSPLHLFEHQTKLFVDLGLFFFAFSNAGVALANVGPLTWLILGSLVVGKTLGVTLFGLLGKVFGLSLPDGMSVADLIMAGFIAALGLTVALFVAAEAYVDPSLQGQAKMGALLSGLVGFVAVALGRILGFGRKS